MDWCRIDVSEELGRYVATELWLEPGRYVATELWLEPGRYVATELWLSLGRYVATERDGRLIATFSRCVFHHMVLIFHSFKGFSDLDLDMHVFQIWKMSGTTYLKSSRRLPGSRLTESSPMSLPFITDMSVFVFNYMVLIFHSFKGGFDMQVFQIRKASGTTYMLVV
ncbi:hypothetical protein F2Q68_00034610 [Brassica cretica]|uniref:Uncharacterized protein n=1 Tax=Brassica cretica TaxID=69181 RepID=A0A8S9H3X2_BRACR|nr:hypothetical protein F2Q68_00034610 [Brassica cretica]